MKNNIVILILNQLYQKDKTKNGVTKTKIFHPYGRIMEKGQSRLDVTEREDTDITTVTGNVMMKTESWKLLRNMIMVKKQTASLLNGNF